MERLHGRSAVIGRGKKSVGDGNQSRPEIGRLGKVPVNFQGRGSVPSIGLLVGGDADRTVGMVGAVIMMMERLCQAGKEQEGDKE